MRDTVGRIPEEKIDRRNFLDQMRRAVPNFKLDDLFEGLSYPAANELIRFVVSYQPLIDEPEVVSAFAFYEKALADGDPAVYDVVWDAFEQLSNDDFKLYAPVLGPFSQSLADKIVRERLSGR